MKSFKEYMMPSLILVVICLVVTFALDRTYTVTEPIIKMAAEKQAEEARNLVLPGSEGFELLASTENTTVQLIDLKNNVTDVYQAKNGTGFVVTTNDKGYGGKIKVITGFSKDGKIEAVMLLEQKETPGLGTKVGEDPFINQFVGTDTTDSVDTISGATISSKAMIRAVDSALMQMETLKEGGL